MYVLIKISMGNLIYPMIAMFYSMIFSFRILWAGYISSQCFRISIQLKRLPMYIAHSWSKRPISFITKRPSELYGSNNSELQTDSCHSKITKNGGALFRNIYHHRKRKYHFDEIFITTFGQAWDEPFVKMTIVPFQWENSLKREKFSSIILHRIIYRDI